GLQDERGRLGARPSRPRGRRSAGPPRRRRGPRRGAVGRRHRKGRRGRRRRSSRRRSSRRRWGERRRTGFVGVDGGVTMTADGQGPVGDTDDRVRCPWAVDGPGSSLYRDYHDYEWGRPLHGRDEMFERLSLEAFQSGLSWLTILRKREAFRAAFHGFDVEAVARFTEADVERLLADSGIVRNRRKIEAVIANARAVLELPTDLDELLWSFAPPRRARRSVTVEEIPAV